MTQLIIDGDGHFVEPPNWIDDHVSEKGKKLAAEHMAPRLEPGSTPEMPFGLGDALTPGGLKPGRPRGRTVEEAEPGGYDARARLVVHDSEDIAAAVLFPTFGLGFPSIEHREWAVTACEALNRWAADYCSAAPKELYSVATLPAAFPELAAAELKRCVTEYGFVGALVRPNPLPGSGRTLGDPELDPLWQACIKLGVPATVHTVASPGDREFAGGPRAKAWFFAHAMHHAIEAQYAFGEMYVGKVFERFPELKVGYMESGSGWPPFWVNRLHEHAENLGWLWDKDVRRLPEDVFREQCVVTAEGEDAMAPVTQSFYGDETVLWASDYPHFDVEPPYTKLALERDDLTDTQRDGLLRRAPLKFYGLDEQTIVDANRKRRSAG